MDPNHKRTKTFHYVLAGLPLTGAAAELAYSCGRETLLPKQDGSAVRFNRVDRRHHPAL